MIECHEGATVAESDGEEVGVRDLPMSHQPLGRQEARAHERRVVSPEPMARLAQHLREMFECGAWRQRIAREAGFRNDANEPGLVAGQLAQPDLRFRSSQRWVLSW